MILLTSASAALRSPQHSMRSQRKPSLLLKTPRTSRRNVSRSLSHERWNQTSSFAMPLMKSHLSSGSPRPPRGTGPRPILRMEVRVRATR
ncbi:hypothetical protein BN1723_010406 [Verticillium longisporum]|uniref:Uncharacterized protein n=1 Tax=Verticillium longisporum TaxID=100787 RepID=A0A0G4KXX3_VERLO|nr:hypothetical protein BN1723_010406 [Verticillium longisporum]